MWGCSAGGQWRGQGQGQGGRGALASAAAPAQVLPAQGRAGLGEPSPWHSSLERRGRGCGYGPLPQHRKGPSVLSTLMAGTGAAGQSPVGQRWVSVGHNAPGGLSSSRTPQPLAWGCVVTQLALPGRGFALGPHCPLWAGL